MLKHKKWEGNLCLYSNFEPWSSDGQCVTDNDKDIPAIYKLHAVWPSHCFIVVSAEERVELLCKKNQQIVKHTKNTQNKLESTMFPYIVSLCIFVQLHFL